MANLTLFQKVTLEDPRPLVEQIMGFLGKPIGSVDRNYGRQYIISDWVYAISESKATDKAKPWRDIKSRLFKGVANCDDLLPTMIKSFAKIKIKTAGGPQEVDTCNEEDLYFLATKIARNTTQEQVVKLLISLGKLKFEEAQREAQQKQDPYQLQRQKYLEGGKDPKWVEDRIEGKIKREAFTTALHNAVIDMQDKYYGYATNEIYLGLWSRTSTQLKEQLEVPKGKHLRDYQPAMALAYQGIAELLASEMLSDKQEISWSEAEQIVRVVATEIGEQAKRTSRMLKKDIATGRPLLPS